ncbi:Panacea domain-containing protein [Halomonas alkaliantarctica]|uniref:Panacea domain-containing protein n=1 Tax=Halomonas alkaliantarctica TaxID=232346 RepID=UPI00265856F4|nr:type II toxin-antitoxin system antitoxin SocA domain-containing protein [Halomonas alkaliantarctica]
MASSEAVANYFLAKSFEQGVPLTPMQLLKLVYIAHGWHRGYFQQNLIDDAVEAWRYGPVIPGLYHKVKKYGRGHIYESIDGFSFQNEISENPPHANTIALLEKVWDVYKDKNGLELSALTHESGTPWDKVWTKSSEPGHFAINEIIPNELIQEHYQKLIGS